MTKITIQTLAASAILILAGEIQASAQVTVTQNNNLNGSAGGNDYTNASSIPVSSTDALEGLLPISTNYVGTNESAGGTLGVLTDGTTGTPPSAPTSASNGAFDLNNGNWYAEYNLGSAKTISSIVTTTGHQDFRTNQHYDLLLSNDGVNFTSLSDGSTQTVLGTPGAGFSDTASSGAGGAEQTTISNPTAGNLGTAQYVEFVVLNNGEDVYRELDVNASAVPEPSTWMAAGGLLLLAAGDFRRRLRA